MLVIFLLLFVFLTVNLNVMKLRFLFRRKTITVDANTWWNKASLCCRWILQQASRRQNFHFSPYCWSTQPSPPKTQATAKHKQPKLTSQDLVSTVVSYCGTRCLMKLNLFYFSMKNFYTLWLHEGLTVIHPEWCLDISWLEQLKTITSLLFRKQGLVR